MPKSPDIARAISELRLRCEGEVLDDAATLHAYGRNFGGMVERVPVVVVRPVSAQAVMSCLRVAVENGLSIATRGAGHCQSSQALGTGLVLDMSRLCRVLAVDSERAIVEAEPGATWRQVIDATYRLGLLPVGLGQVVETTLAGTLSVAGIGGESFRTGPQVDQIAYFDVATLDGQVVRCDLEQHRELFDAVRAGLGQCGVVLKVGYRLRPCPTGIETAGFVYRDAAHFLQDAYLLSRDAPVGRWLTSTVAHDPFSANRRALILLLGQEHRPGTALGALTGLRADFALRRRQGPLWAADGKPGHPFFHVLANTLSGRHGAAPESLNPWIEQVMPFDAAAGVVEDLLDARKFALGSGSAGVRFIRRGSDPAPLFVTPRAELLVGLGLFASFAGMERQAAEGSAASATKRMAQGQGKRYLSGYMVRTAADWRDHYAEAWAPFCAAKRRYDVADRLNPGFVAWPDW